MIIPPCVNFKLRFYPLRSSSSIFSSVEFSIFSSSIILGTTSFWRFSGVLGKGVGLTFKNFIHFVSPLKRRLIFKEIFIVTDFSGSRIKTFTPMFVWGISCKTHSFAWGLVWTAP